MKKHMTSLSVSLALLSSCASPSKVHLETSHVAKRTSDATIAIQIIDISPTVRYKDTLGAAFGDGNTYEQIMNFYKRQLSIDIKDNTTFKDARVFDGHQNIQNIKYVQYHYGDRLNVRVPLDGTKYEFIEYEPDYVLIIDNLNIRTEGKGSDYPSTRLNYISDFALWDNKNRNLVSYGHIEKHATILYPVITFDMDTWRSVSRKYVRTIFDGSPFIENPN